MKTVALEDIYIATILTFCENAAELGCPKDKEVDMWFRELPYEEQYKVAQKMMEIEERCSCEEPQCPIHGKNKMVGDVCHGTHIIEEN